MPSDAPSETTEKTTEQLTEQASEQSEPAEPASKPTDDSAPPDAVNVATAYPNTSSPIPRLLTLLALFASLLALAIHQLDHPLTQSIRSSLQYTLSRFTTTSSPAGNIVYTAPVTESKEEETPRIAVCYSGNVGMMLKTYQQNVQTINQLDPNAHFFFHLDLHDDYINPKTNQHFHTIHQIEDLQPVFDATKARTVKIYSPQSVRKPREGRCYKRPGTDPNHYTRHFFKFYAEAACYDLIKQSEEALQISYEWIINLQPNMNIAVTLPEKDVQTRVHMNGAAMFLIPRVHADIFYSIIQVFSGRNCEVMDQMGEQPCRNYHYEDDCVECLIVKWLADGGVVPSNGVYVNRRIIYPDEQS